MSTAHDQSFAQAPLASSIDSGPSGDWALHAMEQTVVQQFLDDLIAANRFKTYLLSTGADVPEKVVAGLARLIEASLDDREGNPSIERSTPTENKISEEQLLKSLMQDL
jgi:hypothetical protein